MYRVAFYVVGGHIVRNLISSVSRIQLNSVSLLDAILNVNDAILNNLIILSTFIYDGLLTFYNLTKWIPLFLAPVWELDQTGKEEPNDERNVMLTAN